jgi:cytosine/adenosine deaminase-related metal-dependent hydrolase
MQHARGAENARAVEAGEYPRVKIQLEEVFNLGTIQGARAVNMAEKIGSIEVGKLADLVVFNATSPNMVCVVEENPVAAILLHANAGDIEVVIVDGIIRKEAGQLVDVGVLGEMNGEVVEFLAPGEVSKQLSESRRNIIERARGQDVARGMEFLYKTFG